MRVFIVVGQPAHFIRADGAVTFYGITFVHVCGHPIHLFLVDPTLFDDGSPIRAQKDYKTLLVAFSSFAHQSANIVVNMRPLIAWGAVEFKVQPLSPRPTVALRCRDTSWFAHLMTHYAVSTGRRWITVTSSCLSAPSLLGMECWHQVWAWCQGVGHKMSHETRIIKRWTDPCPPSAARNREYFISL